MKTLLSWSLFALLLTNSSIGQGNDSLPISDAATVPSSFRLENFPLMGCAHSHDCCSIGCTCCPEVNREQQYQVLQTITSNGIRRKIVAERYSLAAYNSPNPVRFEFFRGDSLLAWYYSTRQFNTKSRFNWDYDSTRFDVATELVFDATGAHFLIDQSGKKCEIDFQHITRITDKIEQVSIVSNAKRIFGLRQVSGEMLTPLAYSNIEYVSEGYFIASKVSVHNGVNFPFSVLLANSVVLDLNGKEIVRAHQNGIRYLGEDYFSVRQGDGLKLIHSRKGDQTAIKFQRIEECSDGIFVVMKNNKYGFLDTNGNMLTKAKFDAAASFSNGRAAVKWNGKWGFINRKGEWVIENKYDQVRSFHEGLTSVAIGSVWNQRVWGVIDTNGNALKTKAYDEIRGLKGGLFQVFVNGEGSGFINRKGKEVIPCHYDFLDSGTQDSWFSHGKITARDNISERQLVWLDEKGKLLKQFKNVNYILPLYDRESGDRRELLPYFVFRAKREEALADLSGEMVIPFKQQSFRAWTKTHVLISQGKGYWSYDLASGERVFLGAGSLLAVFGDGVIQLKMDSGECFTLNTAGVRIDTIVEKQ